MAKNVEKSQKKIAGKMRKILEIMEKIPQKKAINSFKKIAKNE